MQEVYSFALTHDWWTWRHPRIRQAFRAAAIMHWLPLVQAKLESNKRNDKEPHSLKQLCGDDRIRIHERNLIRTFNLENLVAEAIPLGLSCRLGIPHQDFCPSAVEWIASTTRLLCARDITLEDTRVYSAYRTPLLRESATLSSNGKPHTNGKQPSLLQIVHKVCEVLDPILIEVDSDITQENETCATDYHRRRRVLSTRPE